jgi:hypothetical protein
MNNIFAKQYRYRRHCVKCCCTCDHHWINSIHGVIMCGGSFTKDGMSTRVDFDGICKRYYPEKMEAENEKNQ